MVSEPKTKEDVFSTWKNAVFFPKRLYEDPPRERVHPLLLAAAVSAVVGVANALAYGNFGRAVAMLILAPMGTVVSVYFWAALVHFGLVVLGGRTRPFKDTAAAVGYAHAPLIFGVVPVLGTVLGYLWHIVVLALGLRHAQRTAVWKAWLAVALGAAWPIPLALVLRAGVIEAFKMPSGSMIPSLLIGDHVFVEKLTYGPLIPWTDARVYSGLPPARGDVIVFKFPENKQQDFIKRVIALPGDTLEVVNGRPVIDGWLVPHCHVGQLHYENRTAEMYVEFLGDRSYLTLHDTDPDTLHPDEIQAGGEGTGARCVAGICGHVQGPFHVAKDEVWVMGDNRDNSHDSRSWRGGLGAGVPFENVKGRAKLVWMSFGPGGGVASERLFLPVDGRPLLPASATSLQPALDKCLAARPPASQTTPPKRR